MFVLILISSIVWKYKTMCELLHFRHITWSYIFIAHKNKREQSFWKLIEIRECKSFTLSGFLLEKILIFTSFMCVWERVRQRECVGWLNCVNVAEIKMTCEPEMTEFVCDVMLHASSAPPGLVLDGSHERAAPLWWHSLESPSRWTG